MRRHEIWTAAGGPGYAGKPRPVIILQNERIEQGASITTCGFTSQSIELPEVRPLIVASPENGLRHDSRAMADKIMTYPRSCIGLRVGRLSEADSAELDRAILFFLGLST